MLWRDPESQKQRTKRGFSSARSAQVWAAKMLVDQVEGSWVDPQRGRTPMSTIIAAWHEAKSLSWAESSARSNGTYIRHRITPRWGNSAVGKISRSGVQEWVNSLYAEDGLSGKTVRIIYGLFSAILEYAVQEGYIPKSPCLGIVLPKKNPPRKVYLTVSQVKRLADECSRHGDAVRVLATTGLRFGELAGLTPEDVSFNTRRLVVRRSATTVGGKIVVGPPKTRKTRTVAFSDVVADDLRARVAAVGPGEYLFHSPGDPTTPMRLPSSGSWFTEAVARLQAEDPSFPHITPHGLRHTAASLLISAGATVLVVSRQLGHEDAAMTLNTYADLFDDDLGSVSAKMSDLWA